MAARRALGRGGRVTCVIFLIPQSQRRLHSGADTRGEHLGDETLISARAEQWKLHRGAKAHLKKQQVQIFRYCWVDPAAKAKG